MTTPNATLRAVRVSLLMSQDDLARALREAGRRAGNPNDASKRLVQRWEAGTTTAPRPVYARALEAVTGLPIEALGFASPVPTSRVSGNGHAGHDSKGTAVSTPNDAPTPQPAPRGGTNYSGVWLSTYEYVSSSRGEQSFTSRHYVVVLQHGNRLTVRSLPNGTTDPGSTLTLDLEVDGNAVTGTWTEHAGPQSFYRGARYHGAIQLLAEPTGRRMAGKWVGFGRDFTVNTGPWELLLMDSSTNKGTLDAYNKQPE